MFHFIFCSDSNSVEVLSWKTTLNSSKPRHPPEAALLFTKWSEHHFIYKHVIYRQEQPTAFPTWAATFSVLAFSPTHFSYRLPCPQHTDRASPAFISMEEPFAWVLDHMDASQQGESTLPALQHLLNTKYAPHENLLNYKLLLSRYVESSLKTITTTTTCYYCSCLWMNYQS